MGDRTMWAVGDDDGVGWVAIHAKSEIAARTAFAKEHDRLREGRPDKYIIATRVPSWDRLTGPPTGADWLRAGLSYSCAGQCGEMAFLDDGGAIVDGDPYCEHCAPKLQQDCADD